MPLMSYPKKDKCNIGRVRPYTTSPLSKYITSQKNQLVNAHN
ncbi:hypothetical protein DSUL_20407 [Desulfovibrionales bacterium]